MGCTWHRLRAVACLSVIAPSLAYAGQLEEIKTEFDKCLPDSISDYAVDQTTQADFIWYSDFDNCGRFARIYNFVVNNSKGTGLIFRWDKGLTWADRHNPLAPGAKAGLPFLVPIDSATVELDAPILYTQNYDHLARASAYVRSATVRVEDGDFPSLEAKLESAVLVDGKVQPVAVKLFSYATSESVEISLELYEPSDVKVGISGIPKYLFSLGAELENALSLIAAGVQESGGAFDIVPLSKVLSEDRVSYVPLELQKEDYLFITSSNGAVKFTLPTKGIAPTLVTANIVAISANGEVLGNGPISLWIPTK